MSAHANFLDDGTVAMFAILALLTMVVVAAVLFAMVRLLLNRLERDNRTPPPAG